MSNDPTLVKALEADTEDDRQNVMLVSHERRISALEEDVAENNETLRPVRWILNRVSAGIGSALTVVAGAWAAWFFELFKA